MGRLRLLVAAIAIAVILAGQAAYALQDKQWSVDEWQCQNNPKRDGVPCLIHDFEWCYPINGDYVYELYGDPPSAQDPDVSQTITNFTYRTWTDWHVDIINGWIVVGSVDVHNVNVPSPAWTVGYTLIPGYADRASGFFAEVVPGQGTHVDRSGKLYVFFSYELDGSGKQVSITQYPTDTSQIPEPASLAGLLTGLAALGFGVRRRVK